MIVTASMHSIKNITESLSCRVDWELRLRCLLDGDGLEGNLDFSLRPLPKALKKTSHPGRVTRMLANI